MPRKVKVYDVESGAVVPMWGIDADRVTRDFPERWSKDSPKAAKRVPATEPAAAKLAVGAVVETTPPPPAQAETTAPPILTSLPKGEVETAPPKDDLTRINGIGPALARHLAEAGIDSFANLRDMTPGEVHDFETTMKFKGRVGREDWQGQAAKLAAEAST